MSSGPGLHPQKTWAILLACYQALQPQRRRRLWLVVLATLAGAVAEVATIGAVVPFLALISDPARAAQLPGWSSFLALIGGGSHEQLVGKAAFLLMAAATAGAAARLLILRLTQNLVVMAAHDLSTTIFSRMLRQPYSLYVSRNSAELLSSMEKLQMVMNGVLVPLVQVPVALVLAIAISALLFALNPWTAAAAAGSLACFYVVMAAVLGRRLRANSASLAETSTARMQTYQEAIGSMRNILLEGSQPAVEESYRRLDLRLRHAQATGMFASAAPRFLMEAIGIILIGFIAVHASTQPGGLAASIPLLGALAMGAHRLMPLAQQVFHGTAAIQGSVVVLGEVAALLTAPIGPGRVGPVAPLAFSRELAIDGVSFHFESRRDWALRDISLTIARGARLGIVGHTGSGKSTFFDLVMGLLQPMSGAIRVDGEPIDDETRAAWQRCVAHVPQSVYLTDSSVAANIAFSGDGQAINLERVRAAAEAAQIDSFISSLPSGYETRVGERGVQLSGGERQRVAIARALYRSPALLILDEATAALDETTEAAVMKAIGEADPAMTILVATHRPSALAICERVVTFSHGRVVADSPPLVDQGLYRELQ